MLEIVQTEEFVAWLAGLPDLRARERIGQRIVRAQGGLLGDVKYFLIALVKCASTMGRAIAFNSFAAGVHSSSCFAEGDKSSQSRDIRRAHVLAKEV